MKLKIVITLSVFLVLSVALFFLLKNNKQDSKQQDAISKTSLTVKKPIDKNSIPDAINKSDTTTRCLLSKTDHLIEYYFSGDNIYTTSSTPNDSSFPTNYTLKVDNEVYRWDSQSNSGTNFIIPNPEKIKQDPSLIEYQKLVPNKYTLDAEGIAEIEGMGYKLECEVFEGDSKMFEPPSIPFTKLVITQTNVPSTTQ